MYIHTRKKKDKTRIKLFSNDGTLKDVSLIKLKTLLSFSFKIPIQFFCHKIMASQFFAMFVLAINISYVIIRLQKLSRLQIKYKV